MIVLMPAKLQSQKQNDNRRKISSVRLKVEQKQLVIDGTWNCLGGVGLQGA